MAMTIFREDERYKQQYWTTYPGRYCAGDSAKRDKDGYFWVIGRTDDVIKVSGYRLGTAEVESALVSHPAVAEAAVIGLPHEVKGQAIHCYCVLRQGRVASDELAEEDEDIAGALDYFVRHPDDTAFPWGAPSTQGKGGGRQAGG